MRTEELMDGQRVLPGKGGKGDEGKIRLDSPPTTPVIINQWAKL
jgi:hypothetical protein